MIGKKINYNTIRTELDILENNLIGFEMGQKNIKQVLEAIKVFRKEIWKMI